MAVRTESFNGMLRIGDERDMLLSRFEIERDDVMKFKPLYEALYLFLQEEGYKHPHGGEPEDLYWERWTPTGTKEQHFWWRLKKDFVGKPYIRYFLALNIQTINISKTEVAYKNKKVSAEKIDLIIRGQLYLQWDINNLFRDSMAWKFKRIFFTNLYREELEFHKEEVRKFSLKLQRLFKQYLEMTAEGEIPQIQQEPMGYKYRD